MQTIYVVSTISPNSITNLHIQYHIGTNVLNQCTTKVVSPTYTWIWKYTTTNKHIIVQMVRTLNTISPNQIPNIQIHLNTSTNKFNLKEVVVKQCTNMFNLVQPSTNLYKQGRRNYLV